MLQATSVLRFRFFLWQQCPLCSVHHTLEHYEQVGKALGGSSSPDFSTFFLSFDGTHPIIPCHTDGGLKWFAVEAREGMLQSAEGQPWEDAEFRALVLSSEAAQSTDPERMATEDETLHEIMLIQPLVRLNCRIRPVYLLGAVNLPETLSVNGRNIDTEWLKENVFNRISLGGGRTRGRGRVALHSGPVPGGEHLLRDTSALDIGGANRSVILRSIKLSPDEAIHAGSVQLAVHREWDITHGAGRKTNHVGLCWEIGSITD